MPTIRILNIIIAYGIALCGILPLFSWLTPLPRLLLGLGMAAGIWQDRHGAWPIRNWLLNISVVPFFLMYLSQFSRSNAAQPVVSLLAVMLAVRLLGDKSPRHQLQIHALSLFCLASSSLFDLSPRFLIYLTALLFLVALSLVLLTFQVHGGPGIVLPLPELRRIVGAGLLMPLLSLPLLAVFFPILPRTQLPLWAFLSAPVSGSTGFTTRVEPGNSSSVQESGALAFRAEVPRQPQQRLYWRGTVFNRLEGRRWVRDPAPPENIRYGANRVSQMMYPEPGMSRFLFALDVPAGIAVSRAKRSADAIYEIQPTSRRMTYTAESSPAGALTVAGTIDRAFYLRLPPDLPAPIRNLAAAIRAKGAEDAQRVQLLEDHFRREGYAYAMQGLPTGEHALEQFLFEQKKGNCEFFASAFAVVLRAAGVPARLVGGYLGGEYNDLGGYYLVREQMAHVWVEAFIAGRWVRIDPSGFARNADTFLGRQAQQGPGMRLRLLIDSLDHAWNRSIINYDLEHQIQVARSAGMLLQGLQVRQVPRSLVGPLLVLAAVALALILLPKYRVLVPKREERLLRRFYKLIEQDCKIKPIPGKQGLFELARLTGNAQVLAFVEIYAAAVYHDRLLTAEEVRRLHELLQKGFRIQPAGDTPLSGEGNR